MDIATATATEVCFFGLHAPAFTVFILQDMPIVSSLLSMKASPIISQPQPGQTPRDSGAPSTSHPVKKSKIRTSGCTQTLVRQLVDPARVPALSSTGALTITTALIWITTPAGAHLTESMLEEAGAPATDVESMTHLFGDIGCIPSTITQ